MEEKLVDDREWKTWRGNTLHLYRVNPFGFLQFRYTDGGVVPAVLDGSYTNVKDAESDAEKYLKTQPDREFKEPPIFEYKEAPTKTKIKKKKVMKVDG